jgi:hypothetical protein
VTRKRQRSIPPTSIPSTSTGFPIGSIGLKDALYSHLLSSQPRISSRLWQSLWQGVSKRFIAVYTQIRFPEGDRCSARPATDRGVYSRGLAYLLRPESTKSRAFLNSNCAGLSVAISLHSFYVVCRLKWQPAHMCIGVPGDRCGFVGWRL